MDLITLIVVLCVIGLAWWFFSTYVLGHLPEPIRTIIVVLLALAVCLWLLSMVGVIGPIRLR